MLVECSWALTRHILRHVRCARRKWNSTRDLNSNVWGVSRTTGNVNVGGIYNGWAATTIEKCDGTTPTVVPPADVIICDGQVREASNDNVSGVFDDGTVTVLAMYPKQPFDFAGRTGTVSFDVSNDTNGSHSTWPEFWISDKPVPAPFTHFATWHALPANGLGIRFAANADIGSFGNCPNDNNINQLRWTVSTAVAVRNYDFEDTEGYGVSTGMAVTDLDCVIESSGPGQMNHVEIRISQSQIDVYATDGRSGCDSCIAQAYRCDYQCESYFHARLDLDRGRALQRR